MRDFDAVMGDAIGVIPQGHPLRTQLCKALNDSHYNPPEARQLDWRKATWIINDHFKSSGPVAVRDPVDDWEATLLRVWMDLKYCPSCHGSLQDEQGNACECAGRGASDDA